MFRTRTTWDIRVEHSTMMEWFYNSAAQYNGHHPRVAIKCLVSG